VLKHVTIRFFEAFETSKHALVKKLRKLLKECDSRPKLKLLILKMKGLI
jgi:hypothetical protein